MTKYRWLRHQNIFGSSLFQCPCFSKVALKYSTLIAFDLITPTKNHYLIVSTLSITIILLDLGFNLIFFYLCKMADISTVLANIFLVLSWLVILILSIYLMYQVIKYLREKPPNTQTLLDGLYIQMFSIWIYFALVSVASVTIIGLDIRVDTISFIVGNAVNIAMFLSAINLILSCCYRIILISNPTMIEHLLDEDILSYSM